MGNPGLASIVLGAAILFSAAAVADVDAGDRLIRDGRFAEAAGAYDSCLNSANANGNANARKRHTFVAYVEDVPGVLNRISSLFRRRGYDQTTMRAIAQEAGVSLGNAYYYFASKDHLIHAYYERSHQDLLVAVQPLLDRERDLKKRLIGVLCAKVETSAPYHRFAGQLFKTAADPNSPLSPFSDTSLPVRKEATALFEEVLEGSTTKVTGKLREELPEHAR